MKKGLSALFFVLVAASMLVSNVFAAPAQSSNMNATLTSTTYQRGGVVLLFQTTGLSKSDLKNISLTAHLKQWDISCNFIDDTSDVRCVVTKKLSKFDGEEFHGALAGFYFSGTIPSARIFTSNVTNMLVITNNLVITETPVVTNTSSLVDIPAVSETPVVTN